MIGVERYWFLFGLAIVWMVFAAVQDIRKREVANWLNFSLVGFALAYRAFYAAAFNDWVFFIYGLGGFALFFSLGSAFYYSKVFAGGDAKLLIGLGVILPFEGLWDFVYVGAGFIILMFLVGAVYSLVYSIILAIRNRKIFASEFALNWKRGRWLIFYSLFAVALLSVFGLAIRANMNLWLIVSLFMISIPLLYIYLKSVEKCMIKLVSPQKLTEGDWILNDIKLKGYIVKKTVHGLSIDDILRLRRAKKKIYVKEGVPFVPAILLTFAIMVFFSAVSVSDFQTLIFSLLS